MMKVLISKKILIKKKLKLIPMEKNIISFFQIVVI